MKSHNPFWWIWLVFFLLPAVKPVFGQQAGELDTSFAIRPNYGALRPVEKAWALADGSVLCFQEGENYFSGKKTGSFFKIRPDGNLDSSYQSPSFTFPCVPTMCRCVYLKTVFQVESSGEVLMIARNGAIVNGIETNKLFFRLSPVGDLDASTPQIPNFQFYLDDEFQPFLGNRKFVLWDGDSLRLYHRQVVRDSLFSPIALDSDSSYPAKFLVQNGKVNYVITHTTTGYQYFPIKLDSNAFSAPIYFSGVDDARPYPIEIDRSGRIYECHWNADTIGNEVFNRIVRRFPGGNLDSSYRLRTKKLVPDVIEFRKDMRYKVDSLGRIWEYRRGGKLFPEYSPLGTSGDFYGYAYELRGGWFWRYDADSGAFLDSVYQEPFEHQLRHQNEQIVMGPNDQNRWQYSRRQPDGTEFFQKVTRFGANGPISTVLADQQGRAIILGDFTYFDANPSPRIARVLQNGLADTSFQCRLFETGMPPAPVTFSFWRNDPSQGFLLVSSKPCGGLNRFLYHILPNGDIDSSYAFASLSVLGSGVTEFFSAAQTPGGSLFISVRLNKPDSTRFCFLARLMPSGVVDPGFLQQSIHHYVPNLANPTPQNGGPFVQRICPVDDEHWALGINRKWWYPDPPCKSASSFSLDERWSLIFIDSSGVATGESTPEVSQIEFTQSNIPQLSQIFISEQLNIFPGPEIRFYRLKPNLSVDSTFQLRYPNGAVGWDTLFVRHIKSYLQTKNGDYFFSLFKTNPEGIFDTSFQFRCTPKSLAEPDTNHLYMAGGFQFFGEKVAPYLVRVHNRTSVVTALSDLRKSSQVVLYPNPVGETVHIAGWKPGMVLRITSVEGKILFEGTVSQECASATLGLSRGLYFWSASHRGQPVGGGRLIR